MEAHPMKLYMNPLSPNVRRVRITAALLELPLEEKTLDFTKGEHKSPDYVRLNPNGAVPTLVDGTTVLTESRAIMQYLAAKKPESGLFPRDEPTRADVTRWQFWDAAHFSPQLGSLTFEKIIKAITGQGAPDQTKINEALAGFRRFGAVLNQRLDGKHYVVGNSLTLADLTLACSLMYAQRTETPLAEFPHLQSWFSRISELDAWKKTTPS
jgi:glutathione S-transferase